MSLRGDPAADSPSPLNHDPHSDTPASDSPVSGVPPPPPHSRSSISLSLAQSPRRSTSTIGQTLKSFFTGGSKEKARLDSLVSTSGSIQKVLWDGLNRKSSTEKRLTALKQLHQVLTERVLQVSTLEGLYHDTKDMLTDEDTKEATLKMLIELTKTQFKNLGLALRQQFFETIRAFGCSELSLTWLSALSEEGMTINAFERDMDDLMADWVTEVLREKDHEQATLVLQLCQSLIRHNSAYISKGAVKKMVDAVCHRGFLIGDHLTEECLNVLDCVLKYNSFPRDMLFYFVCILSIQICDEKYMDQSWNLTKTLLSSQLGHRTRKNLQTLLEDARYIPEGKDSAKTVLMLRGAVFSLANANWGYTQSDLVRSPPGNIIASFEKALSRHEAVCHDIFLATHRLIKKFGRELQQNSWIKIMGLFRTALDLFQERPSYAEQSEKTMRQQLMMAEAFYREDQFTGSPDMLYDVMEKAMERWTDASAATLIEYRMNKITPLVPDWISKALDLVRKYSDERQNTDRREKVIGCLHALYTRVRVIYESDIVQQLILPVMQEIPKEKEPTIQYQMLNVLFDVAKQVNFRSSETDLFAKVMKLVRQLMNSSIAKAMPRLDEATEESSSIEDVSQLDDATSLTLDNFLVMAAELDNVLDYRWKQLTTNKLNSITNILVEHIDMQYKNEWLNDEGAMVREKVIGALLKIHCCPITNRLQRFVHGFESEPETNVFIKRRQEGHEGGFSWSEICRIITMVLTRDTSWPVICACLERMARILENIPFVKTAGDAQVDVLIHALVGLYTRCEAGAFEVPDELLAKFLPPVLATLLNYTHSHEWRNREICRVLIDCVQSERHMEALMAIDVAVQLVPEPMSSCAFRLLEILRNQEQNATRAIPVIEFMSDSAEITEFHKLFTEAHYRIVVDILAPYCDSRKYNPYVLACIHRILMRWYTQIPNSGAVWRVNIANYIEQKVKNIPLEVILESMKRQYSGDGRQIPGKLFMLGGQDTPPPMDGCIGIGYNVMSGEELLSEEIQRAMSAYFKLGYIEDAEAGCSAQLQHPDDRYDEVSMDHFFINDTIVSIRRLVDKRDRIDDRSAGDDDVFSSAVEVGSPSNTSDTIATSFSSSYVDQQSLRRRHQSAIQRPRNLENKPVASGALDDLYANRGPHRHNFKPTVRKPLISFVHLTVRHMYGKSSWLMRAADEWPDDFERSVAVPGSSASLIFHMLNVPSGKKGSVRLGKKKDDEDLNRALRNLDRVFGVENHVVGVLYMGPNQRTDTEILSNVYGSERYARFIKGLGEVISLEKKPGGLVDKMHGSYTYSYRDAISSITYLVATLMPNNENDPQCNGKKKLIANNFVSIVFNESGKEYKMGTITGQFDSVTLEVVPSDANSVVITVHAKQQIACWMAMRRVLLSDAAACRLLRKMIIRAQLSVNTWQTTGRYTEMGGPPPKEKKMPYLSLAIDRLRKIHAIREKNAALSLQPPPPSSPAPSERERE